MPTLNEREAPPAAGAALAVAIERLAADGLVAYPTETVWGLAARAQSPASMRALLDWKGRGADQPISVLVASRDALRACGFELSPLAGALMDAFWPGPLTLVLPCTGAFAPGIARADGAVGVRCSSHPLAAALALAAHAAGLGPLTATSLNRSRQEPAGDERAARAVAGDAPGAPFVLAADRQDAAHAPPSTVLDLTVTPPRILRVGAIDAERLRAHLAPGTRVLRPEADREEEERA